MTNLPTWPDFAKNVARLRVESQQILDDMLADPEVDKKQLKLARQNVEKVQKMMDRYGITIRSAPASA